MQVVIFGSGGHGRTLSEILARSESFSLTAFVESTSYFQREGHAREVLGIPIIPEDEFFVSGLRNVVIGVGQVRSHSIRANIFSTCLDAGLEFPVVAASSSFVSQSAYLSSGVQVLHNAFIGPGVTVGNASILNNYSQVEHGTKVGNFCHISTGVIINGDVTIGDGVFIGSGSVVRNGVSIAPGTFVPMCSIVSRDIES